MDKNTIIGLVLIVAVLIGFSYISNSGQQQASTSTTALSEKSGNMPEKQIIPTDTADTTSLFSAHRITGTKFATSAGDQSGSVTLRNKNIIVVIDKIGGTPSKVLLRNYKSYDDFHAGRKDPLVLYTTDKGDAGLNFSFRTADGTIETKDYAFTAVNQKDSTEVTMQLTAKDSSTLALTYKLLPGDNYMMNIEVNGNGLNKHLATNSKVFSINWHQKIQQHEKGYDFENQYSTITYKLTGKGTEKLSEHGDAQETAEGATDWVAFKNQYFSTVLIAPTSEFSNLKMNSRQILPEQEKGYLKDYRADMEIPFVTEGKGTQLQFYFGPNSINLLKSMDSNKLGQKDLDLEELVYLGWPIVKWINRFFTIYVFDFLTWMGLPMGIVLLLITLLLRIIVYVPTRKSFMSNAKMRVLRPKIDEISKKYPNKEDAMKKQQETMTLYSQYGVSPMGGCLPVLIQMPIWIAMFNFIPNAIELRQESFLWADDLSTYDSIWDFGINIWGIGDHLSLFCLLFCVTNLVYSYMSVRQQRESMSTEQGQQMKVMQWMMYLMPLMFFFMFNRYSAGLNYYYFISLLASALTMWYLRRKTDDAKLLAKLEANYKANKNDPNKKPKGLAARLEALQKQAAEIDAQKRRTNKS